MRQPPKCFFVPEEPLESSDMLDPDRSGTLVDSMVRVAVRGCVAMASSTARDYDAGKGRSTVTGCFKKSSSFKSAEMVSKRRAWAPRETMPTCRMGPATAVKAIGGR